MQEQASSNRQNQDNDSKKKDPRDNPVEQTSVPKDDSEPVPVGTPPKPPYEGPKGGGDGKHTNQDDACKQKDPRDHPIEQTSAPKDPDSEPVPVGTPPNPPPYEGPEGGGSGKH